MAGIREASPVGRSGIAKRWFFRGAVFLGLAGGMACLWYFVISAPVPVDGYVVERGPIVSETMGTGTLESRVKAAISPKISGRVATIEVDQGDRVSKGQRLVTLDDEEWQQQVEIAGASVEVSEAGLARLNADRDRALAVMQQADFDYNRTEGLFEQKTAGSVEFKKSAEALGIARAELARSEAAIVEGQKQLIADKKTLAYHRARLTDTEILAPFDGLIVKRHRDPGDVVVPGGQVLTLISTDEVWISAWVDETEMMHLHAEQPARVVFRSDPNRTYVGRVSRLGREADRETREFIVDVRVLELPENWAVGQRAEVYIETDRKDRVTVLPAKYLRLRGETFGVYKEGGGRAVWQPVEVGLRNRDSIEVVEGLEPGDQVVIPIGSKSSLRDGRKVEFVR
ncbi:MAG: efflux RND transporter periplasmic adaptor subunit [Planctomycetes bacterium]|nr:efflux RND transporter periplasmic adaptor subunit [Planctomycetota bacterium]